MATVAFLRGRVHRLAEEVGHLEDQVVQAQEELTEEKAAGARLRQRVRRLQEEVEQLGQANEALLNELKEARAVRAEQEERIGELEQKVLNIPDAQKIQAEVLEQVEEVWGARHQALTLSFQGMAFTMEEREASLEGALRRQDERNEQLEDRLVDLVAAEVRRLLARSGPYDGLREAVALRGVFDAYPGMSNACSIVGSRRRVRLWVSRRATSGFENIAGFGSDRRPPSRQYGDPG